MFHIATENLHKVHAFYDASLPKQLPHHFVEGDTVLIKNHTAGPFDPKHVGDFRIVTLKGNQVELIPSTGGRSRMEHISNIKYNMPAERYISQLPDYESFGRQIKLRLNSRNIPDLSWKWADTIHIQDRGKVTVSHIFHLDVLSSETNASSLLTTDSVESILVNMNVYTQTASTHCITINACHTIVSSCEITCPVNI